MNRYPLPLLLLLALFISILLTGCGGSSGPILVACGAGHLRQAILDANADSDPTTLELEAGCTYAISVAYSDFAAARDEYNGHIALPPITSPITMHGNGAILEVIAHSTRHLYISSTGNLTLDDATLTSGETILGAHPDDLSGGGAIYNDGGVLRATNVTFRDNGGILHGGAIHNRGSLVLDGCLFEDNYALKGGAVYSLDTEDIPLTITDTQFVENSGGYGGAVYSEGANSQISMHAVTFDRNEAEGSGGAIYALDGDLTLSACNFTGNFTDEPHSYLYQDYITEHGPGGAVFFDGERLHAVQSQFDRNHALAQGGGIYIAGEELELSASELNDNAAGGAGGGIYVQGDRLDLSTSELIGNAATGEGGGIYAEVADASVGSTEFEENESGERGGGLYMQGATLTMNLVTFHANQAGFLGDQHGSGDGLGGGLFNDSEANILDSTFTYNVIRRRTDSSSMGLGGGIYNTGQMTIDGTAIAHNSSHRGAGLYNAGDVWVLNSTFYSNYGGEYGGGVYNASKAHISFTTFYLNSVSNWLGVSGLVGAGIYNASGSTYIRNSLVSENISGHIKDDNCGVGSGEIISLGGTRGWNVESILSVEPDGWETCQYFHHVDGDTMGYFTDHGGPTYTVDLIAGQSAAIDISEDCETFGGQWIGVDQRNVTRPATLCDAGAYEVEDQAVPPPPPEPTPQEAPTPTPTEAVCRYVAIENLNCRESDYKDSKLIAILMQGESAELTAVNPTFTHGKFRTQDGKLCWMWFGLLEGPEKPVEVCGVPVLEAPPPPPTATPLPECRPDLDAESCKASGGTWEGGGAAEPVCKCP
jgi:predicted outer membrane repeat protein